MYIGQFAWWYQAFYFLISVWVEGRMMEVQFLRPDLSHFLLTFIDLFKMCTWEKKCLCKSEHVTRGGTQWAIIRLHPWEVPQLLADLRWYETWWTWWTVQSTHSEGSMQVQRVLLTLLHHKLYPQENVPQVQLISVEGAWQLTRSQVLKNKTHTQLWLFKEVKSIFKKKMNRESLVSNLVGPVFMEAGG